MPEIETPEKTMEQVAAEALASWRAAKDAGHSEASMRQQLQASTAVRQARESDERMRAARDYENAHRVTRGLDPLPPSPKAPVNEWERREAEIDAEHKQAQADRATAESNRKEQEGFLAFAKSRYELAMKNGNKATAATWFEAAEAIVDGKWPISKLLNSDPGVMRFAGLRTRLNYLGRNRQI